MRIRPLTVTRKISLKNISLVKFFIYYFVDKETKSWYDEFVSKESKSQP
jgi:hypothetical protein